MKTRTSRCLRLATTLALALCCAVGLGACASPSQKVATSKEQGDNSTAADQTTQQNGFLTFSKSTQAVGLAGGSLLTVITLIIVLNYRVLMRVIPLVNTDEHRATTP